jgi:hypothetical protein
MGKVGDYSLALLPQEVADCIDDMRTNWNYGKYQIPVVTSVPNWTGRLGEMAIYAASNTWSLMICTSDQTTRWAGSSLFYP